MLSTKLLSLSLILLGGQLTLQNTKIHERKVTEQVFTIRNLALTVMSLMALRSSKVVCSDSDDSKVPKENLRVQINRPYTIYLSDFINASEYCKYTDLIETQVKILASKDSKAITLAETKKYENEKDYTTTVKTCDKEIKTYAKEMNAPLKEEYVNSSKILVLTLANYLQQVDLNLGRELEPRNSYIQNSAAYILNYVLSGLLTKDTVKYDQHQIIIGHLAGDLIKKTAVLKQLLEDETTHVKNYHEFIISWENRSQKVMDLTQQLFKRYPTQQIIKDDMIGSQQILITLKELYEEVKNVNEKYSFANKSCADHLAQFGEAPNENDSNQLSKTSNENDSNQLRNQLTNQLNKQLITKLITTKYFKCFESLISELKKTIKIEETMRKNMNIIEQLLFYHIQAKMWCFKALDKDQSSKGKYTIFTVTIPNNLKEPILKKPITLFHIGDSFQFHLNPNYLRSLPLAIIALSRKILGR